MKSQRKSRAGTVIASLYGMYYLMVFFTLILVYFFFTNDKNERKDFSVPTRQEVTTQPVRAPASIPQTVKPKPLPAPPPEVTESNNDLLLQDKLDTETLVLQDSRDRISDIRSQLAAQPQTPQLQTQISSNQIRIQNLTETLQALRISQERLRQDEQTQLHQLERSEQYAREQGANAIQTQEQNLRLTLDRLDALYNTPLRSVEQDFDLRHFEEQKVTQQRDVDLSRQKFQSDVALAQQQQRNLAAQYQERKNDLTEAETAVQEQIFGLREEIGRLQETASQSRINTSVLNQQLEQAKQNYVDQTKKVSELQEQAKSSTLK